MLRSRFALLRATLFVGPPPPPPIWLQRDLLFIPFTIGRNSFRKVEEEGILAARAEGKQGGPELIIMTPCLQFHVKYFFRSLAPSAAAF